jgi:hypothetical protein
VTAEHQHPDLHALVDQLSPAQAGAVRAVVVQLVAGDLDQPAADNQQAPRRLSFAGTLSAEPDFAERAEEILDAIARRDAG